jgi:hypothetical protein
VAQVLPVVGTQTTQALPVSVSDEPELVSVATTCPLVPVDQAQALALPAKAASPNSRNSAEEPMALNFTLCAWTLDAIAQSMTTGINKALTRFFT